jgi:hypothetical protein
MRTIILTLIFCLITSIAFATPLTIKICDPNICIGGVLWESKPSPHTNYKILEELRTCGINKRTIELNPGWYGITVYDKKRDRIRDYADILIENDGITIEWCR